MTVGRVVLENSDRTMWCFVWMKCMKNERKRDHTSEEENTLGRNPRRFREKKECLGEKKEVFTLDLFKENASQWIEELSRFCRALILDRWICQGTVENMSVAKYLIGLKSYRPNKNFLDGSTIYQEAIKTNFRKIQWIEDSLRSIKKKKIKGLDR